MKKSELKALETQIHLHNNLKGWLKVLFSLTSILAMVAFQTRSCALWIWMLSILFLCLSLILLLTVGFGIWRSQNDILNKLNQ